MSCTGPPIQVEARDRYRIRSCGYSGAGADYALVVTIGNIAGNGVRFIVAQIELARSGQDFQILKFRSMRPDSSVGTDWTTENDPADHAVRLATTPLAP